MKTQNLLIINILITAISFLIIYYFDTPIELIGAAGIAWVFISSIETIRKLRRLRKHILAHELTHQNIPP